MCLKKHTAAIWLDIRRKLSAMKFIASLRTKLFRSLTGLWNMVGTTQAREYTPSEKDLLRRQLQQNSTAALALAKRRGVKVHPHLQSKRA